MKDKVSIITTFHNSENYILKCIHSVWSQETSLDFDIEYILIDDQSEDHTSEIIDLYFKKYKWIYDYKIIKTPENLGCGGARNFGIANSTGNYIMFLDSDDYYIKNDFVLRAYNIIFENNADIVEFGFKYVNENGMREHIVSKDKKVIENNSTANMYALFYDTLIHFMPWTKIIRRTIVETKQYNTSRKFEDIRTTPYWIYNAKKILIENTIEINYRSTNNSIVRENMEETRLGTIKAISELFEYFKDNKDILKAMYDRCLLDLRTIIDLDSDSEYFNKMSKLNTYMLSYIYPDNYKDITYNI